MDDSGDDTRFAHRVSGGGDAADEAQGGELVAPGAIYATVAGQRQAITLEYIWMDNASVTMPYALCPVVWWDPPSLITIEYHNLFSLMLHGTELNELKRGIKDHRITWIREFDEHQAASLASAVTRIEIIRSYPSRDASRRGKVGE